MSLSDQNQAIVGRDREVYTISAADLDRYLDAARAKGPEPQTIPLGAKQAAIEALEPFAIALAHFRDPRPYVLLESFHRAAEALAMLRAEGRPSPEGEEAIRSAIAAIDCVQEASFIEWVEEIKPSRRGQEDEDEARKESKAMVWDLLSDARTKLAAALSTPSPEGEACKFCRGAGCIQEGSPEAWTYETCDACNGSRRATPSPEAGREEGPRHPMFTDPMAWWAETGTAGSGEGCNRPFWLRREAIEYVRRHGGYVKPLYDALSPPAPEPDLFAGNAKKPEPGYEAEPVAWMTKTVEGGLKPVLAEDVAAWRAKGVTIDAQPLFYASPVPVASREDLEKVRSLLADVRLGATRNRFNEPAHYVEGLDEVREALDAILQRLSNQQGGEEKGSIPELPGVSGVQQPPSSTAQHSGGGNDV